jgi:hypothetical protein
MSIPQCRENGSIRTGVVGAAVSWRPRRYVASVLELANFNEGGATCRKGDYPVVFNVLMTYQRRLSVT